MFIKLRTKGIGKCLWCQAYANSGCFKTTTPGLMLLHQMRRHTFKCIFFFFSFFLGKKTLLFVFSINLATLASCGWICRLRMIWKRKEDATGGGNGEKYSVSAGMLGLPSPATGNIILFMTFADQMDGRFLEYTNTVTNADTLHTYSEGLVRCACRQVADATCWAEWLLAVPRGETDIAHNMHLRLMKPRQARTNTRMWR